MVKELKGDDQYVYEATVKNLDQTQLFPVPTQYPDYQNRINPHIDNVLLGKTKPEKALEKAEEDVEKLKKN